MTLNLLDLFISQLEIVCTLFSFFAFSNGHIVAAQPTPRTPNAMLNQKDKKAEI